MNRQKVRMKITLISFLLFPITIYYFSPVLVIEGAFHGIIVGSFIVFAGLFLLSLFFGRVFCGWLCPVGGLQDFCTFIVDKPIRGGKLGWIKYLIWIPWIVLIITFLIRTGGIHQVDITYQTTNGISLVELQAYVIYYSLLGLFVILSLLVGKRAFCNYICWMAPFMIIGTKVKDYFRWPSLKLIVGQGKCIGCKLCNKNCPMSLNVFEMVSNGSMKNSECILCGKCVDCCPQKVIKYSYSKTDNIIIKDNMKHRI